MALITALGLFAVTVLTAALARLAAEEFSAWSPSIIRGLVKFAVVRLPENQRERLKEEWESHVDDVPGQVGKLVVAVGFSIAAYDLTWNDRRKQVLEGWVQLLTQTDHMYSTTTTILNLLQNDETTLALIEGVDLGDELLELVQKQEASTKNRLRSLLSEHQEGRNRLRGLMEKQEANVNDLRSYLSKKQKYRNRLAKRIAVASAIPQILFGNLLYTLVDSVQLRKNCDEASQLANRVRETGANIVKLMGERKEIAKLAEEQRKQIAKLIEKERTRRQEG